MKKVFFLFAWLLTCVCTVQVNAGNVITSIGSNITDVSQITNGSYYIFKSAQYGFLYENATTGRIDPGSGAVVGDGTAYIWQAHAEDGGKFSFSSASGKYFSTPLNDGSDVYTVNASSAAKDKFAISGAGAGKWKLKSSNADIYWDCQETRFVGWDGTGDNCEFEIIPVEIQTGAPTTPMQLSALPDTKTTTVVTGYYMLKQVNTQCSKQGWLKANSLDPGTNVVASSASLTASDPNIDLYIWYVEKQSDGSITIANVVNTAAWAAPSTGVKPLVAYGSKANLYLHSEAVTLGGKTATANEGSFLLSDANTNALVHESGSVLGSWTDANPKSVFMVEFYPIEEGTSTNGWLVNYVYTLPGASSTVTKTVLVADGAIPSAPAPDVEYLTNNSLDKVDAINCNCAIRVACSENLPFVKTTNDSDPNYYALLMHQNTNNDGFVKYSALDTQLTADHATANIGNYAENYATLLNEDGYWWYFKGNVLDGFQIFNKAAGTENNRKLAYGSDRPIVKENPASYTWKLAKSSSAESAKDWTCIRRTDNANYLNLQSGVVKYWSATDNGSSVKFFSPLDIATMTAADFDLMQNYLGAPDGALLGSQYIEQHRAELASAKGQKANNLAAVKLLRDHKEAYNASLAANELNDGLVAGKYYRLYNAGYGKYLTVDPSNSKLVGTQLEDGLKKNYGSVIYIAENGANYTLSAQGKYFGSVEQSDQVSLSDAAVDYRIQHVGARFTFNGGNGSRYGYLHTDGYSKVVGWETAAIATQWYVLPATDIEVALNEVDGAYYGTLYVPFAVKVADSDAASKLYTGSVNAAKNGLVMSKQGTVPAGTGIVIASDNNTATLDITTATGTLASDLQGTYRTMTENLADYLYLGKSNTDNKLGFYANGTGLTSVAANKAFLPKSLASSHSLRMFFNDDVTGISGIETAGDSAAPVFDLSGRRVVRTVKGGVYISNGKKFIAR